MHAYRRRECPWSVLFSLLEAMFGKDQDASLSDLLQAALMLRYNQRQVG